MFTDDELLPISALQHLLFCERQCALIHVEGLWAENRLTVEGRNLHERAHDGRDEARPNIKITRGMALQSLRLGLVGRADVVEFHVEPGSPSNARPFPVEYKRGRSKSHDADRVQLCAQAMCLEEMLGVPVPSGALFYGTPRRRENVVFDQRLRESTERAVDRLHKMIAAGHTPHAKREPKCDSCSLLDLCLPGALGRPNAASDHWGQVLSKALLTTSGPAEDW